VQVANSLLGLFLTGLLIGAATSYARSKGWVPEMHLFGQLVEAMQRIAKGDFSVRLDTTFRAGEPVSVLVKSMNDMALELDAMENMRQEFISNVSHEIQSPLTSIRGFAQALQNDRLSLDERHHYLSIIESESTRLSRITEDLLKIAALESKQLRIEPKTYRLDKQIRSLVLACEPQWAGKTLDIELCLEELAVAADEDLLSQVWSNLIHNSIKFTPPGGSVRVSMRQHDGQIHFQIADTGIGISGPDQARVFERFFKADPSRTRSNGGSGLGLSITKKIVELHGGAIDVASSPGAGTTFSVRLPAE
jgi:two-component system phosphate regulon sensor histidine kinase PhoR